MKNTTTSSTLRRFTGRTLAVATMALLSLGFTAGPSMAMDNDSDSGDLGSKTLNWPPDYYITHIASDGTIEVEPLPAPPVQEGKLNYRILAILISLGGADSALGVGSGNYNLPDLPAKYDCSKAGCCVVSGYASVGGSVSALGVGRDSTSNEFHYSSIGRCDS